LQELHCEQKNLSQLSPQLLPQLRDLEIRFSSLEVTSLFGKHSIHSFPNLLYLSFVSDYGSTSSPVGLLHKSADLCLEPMPKLQEFYTELDAVIVQFVSVPAECVLLVPPHWEFGEYCFHAVPQAQQFLKCEYAWKRQYPVCPAVETNFHTLLPVYSSF
jgi:hypothetical protein